MCKREEYVLVLLFNDYPVESAGGECEGSRGQKVASK
jgi:hypothetical protein